MKWPQRKLGELTSISRGSSPRPIADTRYFEGGTIPWVKIADATKSGKFLYETKEHVNDYGASFSKKLPAGTLLLAASGTLGYTQILGVEACAHDGWLIIQDLRALDRDFAYYALKTIEQHFYNSAYGAAIQNINTDILRETEIPYPPLPTQHKIAAILSAYDDLIENNTRRIKILEEMAQMIYREWFVNFRFPGHEKVKMVKTKLGQVPEGWETAKLGDVATFHRGRSYRTPDLAEEGGLSFLNLKCIERGGGFRHNVIKRYIGAYKPEQIAKTGDLIVAVTDMTQERRLVAHAARVHLLGENMAVMSMDLVRVEPKQDIPKDYLHGMLRFSNFGDEVSQHANGVNVLHLNPAQIEAFQFVLPPSILRNQYAEFCGDAYLQIDALHAKNANLRRTRDLLLPKLISGEVEVS